MNKPYAIIVAVHYPPEISGGAPRILIMEDFLVRAGFRVAIVTPQPIQRGCRGAEIIRVPAPRYLRPGAVPPSRTATGTVAAMRRFCKRWLRRLVFIPDTYVYWALRAARQVERACRRDPPQLVVTSSPQESSHWVGRRLQQRFGCRWLADFRDGWTFEPHRAEALLPLRRQIERRLERAVLERADWITAATLPVAEDFQRRFARRRDRIHFLPSGFEELPGHDQDERDNPDDGLFRLVYTGRFSLSDQARSPRVFIEGLRQAIEGNEEFGRRFRLVVVGELSAEERDMLTGPPLGERLQLMGPQPYETALRIAAGATMLLLITPPGLRSIATRKLFDYLAVRRPVLALAEGNEAARILRETRAGLCVAPDRREAVAAGLLRAFSLWQAGRLDEEIPCSGNDLYRSQVHFSRVFGRIVLPEVFGG